MRILTSLTLIATALTLVSAPSVATAKNNKVCPPGLAKKTPACVPPGLAKKGTKSTHRDDDDRHRYDIGDRIEDAEFIELQEGDRVVFEGREYVVVDTDQAIVLRRGDDWYRLPRRTDDSDYVRVGDAVIRVNRETKQVVELIELGSLLLN